MQVIGLIHHCLHFKFNKKKYLFGLTYTLALDQSAVKKLKIDYIILPANPYSVPHSIFLWHLDLLQDVNCHQLVVCDNNSKKRIEWLMSNVMKTQVFKWQFLQDHNLNEQQLMVRWVQETNSKRLMKVSLWSQPNGLGFNRSGDHLSMIVSQEGRGTILIHECSTILIDPSQRIIESLQYYGIPINSIKLVMLTSAANLSIIQLIMKFKQIKIVTEEEIYKDLKNRLKNYLLFNSEMLREKLKGRILYEANKKHRYSNLQFSLSRNEDGKVIFWDIHFGMKIIRIYHNEIDIYPMEIINNQHIECLIAYNFDPDIKKQLEKSPQIYRKKIIYNRVTKKYNNKYFYTINKGNECITIKSHPFFAEALKNDVQDVSFMFHKLQKNAQLQLKNLKDKESFNTNERIVYVRKGYVRDDKGELKVFPHRLTNTKFVVGQGNALIMYEEKHKFQFYENWKVFTLAKAIKSDDILKKVEENSFVSGLKKRIREESIICLQNEFEMIEQGSQWQLFNSICQMKTFQAGCEMKNTHILYLIVKGSMRYKHKQEELANKNALIGNEKSYYWSGYDQCETIEVVKDTWAIEVSFTKLQKVFFSKYPERLYDLFVRSPFFE